MPEIPDLEVIKAFLNERIVGKEVVRANEVRPAMIRSLAAGDFSRDVAGRRFGTVSRQGQVAGHPYDADWSAPVLYFGCHCAEAYVFHHGHA
jgi:formamidopyrimidine-DNA glycosylase